jgi:N-acyl-L-homoserine lactone synthetase
MFPKLANYRHQVFIEKLGWQLNVSNRTETDQFDGPATVYVVAEEADGTISGCARLLPTNGPYLLADVFPEMLNGTVAPRDPEIWELSRFAAVNFLQRDTTPLAQYSRSTAVHLMREVMACAASHGARRLVTVTVLAMERLMRRVGIRSHRIGPPRLLGGETIYACWIEL